MKLNSFKKNGNKATAIFSIDNSEFEDKINIVWNRQKKWFRVPGFRKGKVPRKIIENEYGKDIFYDSALGLLYPKMVDLLVEETNEKIISIEGELYMSISSEAKPQILNKDENSVETKLEVNIYPKVDIDYNNIQVEVEPKKEATDEEINSQLNMAQRRMGNKHMDAQTKVQEGDFVRLDIDRLDPIGADGKVDENDNTFKKFRNLRNFKLKVGAGQILPVEKALIGHTASETMPVAESASGKPASGANVDMPAPLPAGEVVDMPAPLPAGEVKVVPGFETIIEFPKELPNKDIAGKKVRARLKILAVKRAYTMQEVAENNGFKSLEEFKDSIKEKIGNHHASVYENNKKNAMVEKIVSMIKDDLISEDSLKAKIAHVKNQYKKISESMGQNMEALVESFGGEEEFNNKISEIVKIDLKGIIAFHSIAEKENIKFSDEEIEEYKKKLQSEGMPIDGLSKAEILDRMIGEKVIEFLMSKVKFIDKIQEKPENSKDSDNSNNSDSEDSDLDTDEKSDSEE